MSKKFVDEVVDLIRAGFQILVVNTVEECRAIESIRQAAWKVQNPESKAQNQGMPIPTIQEDKETPEAIAKHNNKHFFQTVVYSTVDGFVAAPECDIKNNYKDNPYNAILDLRQEANLPKYCVVIYKDLDKYVSDSSNPRVLRALREVAEDEQMIAAHRRRIAVFLQPDWQVPPEIRHLVTGVSYPMADQKAMREVVDSMCSAEGMEKLTQPTEDRKELMAEALVGLTYQEANNALFLTARRKNGFPPEALQELHTLKAGAFAGDSVMTYMSSEQIANTAAVGGYDGYMEYLEECRACLSQKARLAGVKRPKGVMLIGPPGTGKSTVAVLTAKVLGLPLVKYDIGAVFGSLVGESEKRQRDALNRVKALGSCVLMIDEADKAFGGMGGSSGDSGVSQRVFGSLLSWLADGNTGAFVVMTANRIVDESGKQVFPVETIRSGRLDCVFSVTFPTAEERDRIFAIHAARSGGEWELLSDMLRTNLVKYTDGFTGAEIEQAIAVAARRTFANTGEVKLNFDALHRAIGEVVTVLKLDPVGIARMNDFAKERATPVSRITTKQTKVKQGRSLG